MLCVGVKGYLMKDVKKIEFKKVFLEVMEKGFYYINIVVKVFVDFLLESEENKIVLKDREMIFIKYVCIEMIYCEIVEKMYLSIKIVEGYCDVIFEKLKF